MDTSKADMDSLMRKWIDETTALFIFGMSCGVNIAVMAFASAITPDGFAFSPLTVVEGLPVLLFIPTALASFDFDGIGTSLPQVPPSVRASSGTIIRIPPFAEFTIVELEIQGYDGTAYKTQPS